MSLAREDNKEPSAQEKSPKEGSAREDPSMASTVSGADMGKRDGTLDSEEPNSTSSTSQISAQPQFSVYNRREKWMIIGLAGLFSPLSANSYLPAIQAIADAFHTSVELINVTVTVYLVLQGISPMLWGTLADKLGRRPLFLVCLILLALSCIGLALVPTNAYWLLVLLRCFQATGSASTIALGEFSGWSWSHNRTSAIDIYGETSPGLSKFSRNIIWHAVILTIVALAPVLLPKIKILLTMIFIGSGVISDIAVPSERGGFLGLFSLGPLVGPCIGPIIGGVLSGSLGWRAIFWFLAIFSGVYAVIFFLLFPETLRVIVGNGSYPAPHWNRPPIPILLHYDISTNQLRPPPKKFVNPLRQFTHPSVVLILLYTGVVYSVFAGVTATLSGLLANAYPSLSQGEIGVCFLAIGLGCAFGSCLNGLILDWEFRRIKKSIERKRKQDGNEKINDEKCEAGKESSDFPIEYARLRGIPLHVLVFVASIIGYAWAIQKAVHIAVPLVLQFFIGFSTTSVLNTAQTILLDLFPTQGSSITAANNLVRCSLGATLVALMDIILRALKPGWTFTLLGGICFSLLPMSFIVVKFGPKWRANRP